MIITHMLTYNNFMLNIDVNVIFLDLNMNHSNIKHHVNPVKSTKVYIIKYIVNYNIFRDKKKKK